MSDDTEVTSDNTEPARIKPPRPNTPEVLQRFTEYLVDVPPRHRLATERVLRAQLTRKAAIKIKCLQCSNYTVAEVRYCPIVICALHAIRPYQRSAAGESEDLDHEDDDIGLDDELDE